MLFNSCQPLQVRDKKYSPSSSAISLYSRGTSALLWLSKICLFGLARFLKNKFFKYNAIVTHFKNTSKILQTQQFYTHLKKI